jgi:cell wall-associated NlpC family hydrolase
LRTRGVLAASIVGLVCAAPGLGGWIAPAGATGTSTTLPGPAPNQSQINATKAQVAQIETTLTQEEQRTSILDDRYDTAVQNLQNAQNALQVIDATLAKTRVQIRADRKQLSNDAITAYVYGAPGDGFTSFFTSSASVSDARDQYTNQIVGNLNSAKAALQTSQSHLQAQEAQQQSVAAQAQSEAAQAKSLALANQQEAAATKATLNSIQGQLAQEVAQAAVEEAQQEAAAAARAASAAAAQKAAAAAAAAATVAEAVGGSSATDAANQAATSAGGSGNAGFDGTIAGTGSGSSQQMAAVQAAVSQLGVPYVFGGESRGVGFDCSGLVQWAWGQAGVSIPRTTESQWPSLAHVSLGALEPGDLLFYYNLDGDDQVDHVVMYTGAGPYGTDTVIQAPFTGSTVSYSPIFTEGLIGAARP